MATLLGAANRAGTESRYPYKSVEQIFIVDRFYFLFPSSRWWAMSFVLFLVVCGWPSMVDVIEAIIFMSPCLLFILYYGNPIDDQGSQMRPQPDGARCLV